MRVMSLKELAESAFEVAKGIIEKMGEEAQPCFLIQTEASLTPVITIFNNQTEKEAAFRNIHHMLLETRALSYAFVSEGWSLSQDDARNWDGKTRPSEHPNKIEVLSVDAWSSDGQGFFMISEIKRLGGKRRRVMEPKVIIPGHDGASSEGLAIDLFTPR